MRASLIALRVTARSASSMRYRNASTWRMSNAYSRSLLPRAACARSTRAKTASSRRVLGTPPTTRFFPTSAAGTTNESAMPVRPARAVRPTRCVYAREEEGRSKLITHETSTKSTPRETPYSASGAPPPLRFLRLFDFD